MGFFSWLLEDGESIRNAHTDKGAVPVEMVTLANVYPEPNYQGYGVFGGADYYELVDLLNGGTGKDRDRGITLALDPPEDAEVILPRFRRPGDNRSWQDLEDPDICPDQGYWI